MTKRIVYLVIVFLLLVNAFSLYQYQKLRKSVEAYKELNVTTDISKSLVKELIIHQQPNSCISLQKSIVLTNEANESISITDIFKEGDTRLVIRSSEEGCGMCIENELRLVQKYADQLGQENIIIITTHKNARKLKVFKKMNAIDFDTYFSKDLGFPIEKISEKVFAFLINSDLNTSCFFTPNVELPYLSEQYYTSIYQSGLLNNTYQD